MSSIPAAGGIKRAAIYIRVSSDEQARHGLSLGEQRADLLDYSSRKKYAVVDIYADEGVSARKSLSRRKELKRLLGDVERGEIDVIVIKCLDRWFRNVADFYKVQEVLEKYHVGWECSQEQFNTTTPEGQLTVNLLLSLAQMESDRTGQRIKYVFNGKKERKEALTGNLPVGYKIINKRIVPDEEKAPLVRYMFQAVHAGSSIHSLPAKVLSDFGVRLSYAQVRNALKNRIYIGERHGIIDYCPPIVSVEIFEHVQARIGAYVKKPLTGRIYLFSGLIRCPCCGHPLSGKRGFKNAAGQYNNFAYNCVVHERNNHLNLCSFSRSIGEKKIENYLLDNIQQYVRDRIVAIDERRRAIEAENGQETIKSISAKMERLKILFVNGLIDLDAYKADHAKLKAQIDEISRRAMRSVAVSPALRQIVNEKDFRATYESLDREHKRKFWQSLLSRIDFDDVPENRGYGKVIKFSVQFA